MYVYIYICVHTHNQTYYTHVQAPVALHTHICIYVCTYTHNETTKRICRHLLQYTRTHMYIHTYIHIYTHTQSNLLYAYAGTYYNTHARICRYIHTYTHTHNQTYYTHTQAPFITHTHICTYIHTHTHTHNQTYYTHTQAPFLTHTHTHIYIYIHGHTSKHIIIYTPTNKTYGHTYTGTFYSHGYPTPDDLWIPGVWQHITWVIIPRADATLHARWRIFVNGTFYAEIDSFSLKNLEYIQTYIGRTRYGQGGIYSGYMDEFMIFPFALTDNEVRLLAQVSSCLYTSVYICMHATMFFLTVGLCNLS